MWDSFLVPIEIYRAIGPRPRIRTGCRRLSSNGPAPAETHGPRHLRHTAGMIPETWPRGRVLARRGEPFFADPAMTSRKDAIREYKERPPNRGIFAIRRLATDRAWVGSSLNLDATRNRTWFALRMGQHHDRPLQAEWHAHGEAAFQYDVLETLKDDVVPMAIADLLKEKTREWAARLGAPTLL
jgi:hypothetical protein